MRKKCPHSHSYRTKGINKDDKYSQMLIYKVFVSGSVTPLYIVLYYCVGYFTIDQLYLQQSDSERSCNTLLAL